MRKSLLLLTVLMVGAMALTTAASAELDARPLPERLAEPSPEGPSTDTALVFTNLLPVAARVKLHGWNAAGEELASGSFEVPANGLVYILASRLAEEAGVDGFVGHVKAKATGYVVGSTVILGGRVTDIDTINHVQRRRRSDETDAASPRPAISSRMTFPVVATY